MRNRTRIFDPAAEELCLSPRGRQAVLALFWVYLLFQVGMNTFLRMIPGDWREWVSPPFAAWSLYAAGSPEQRAVEVSVIDVHGLEKPVDLDEYFLHRQPHSSDISLPERCEPLLKTEPVEPHLRLLDVLLREYNRRHAHDPATAARSYLLTWNMDTQRRSEALRTLVAERRL